METLAILALALGASWAAGVNLYAAVLTLGLMANMGYATLPPGLTVLQDPLVLAAAGFMYLGEFVADKTPGVDSGWDAIHTFIRIPAGAILAASVADGFHMNEAAVVAAALVGGGLAATSHFTKAGTRLLVNASPEPFSNWSLSVAEDVAVVAGLWAALMHPASFLVALALFVLLALWLLPRILRLLRGMFARIGRWLGRRGPAAPSGQEGSLRLPAGPGGGS